MKALGIVQVADSENQLHRSLKLRTSGDGGLGANCEWGEVSQSGPANRGLPRAREFRAAVDRHGLQASAILTMGAPSAVTRAGTQQHPWNGRSPAVLWPSTIRTAFGEGGADRVFSHHFTRSPTPHPKAATG